MPDSDHQPFSSPQPRCRPCVERLFTYNKPMRCIYCLNEKSSEAFTKVEHVIPQAFGLFQNNFTLKGIVCDECNQYFGDNLEIDLGRDTVEGISRYEYGIRNPEDFKSLGKRSRLQHKKIAEGILKGAFFYLSYSQELNKVTPKPLPQVGFQDIVSLDYSYFLLEDIPDKKTVENQGLNCDVNVRAFGDDFEMIEQVLAKKGIFPEFQKEIPLSDKKSEKLLVEYEASIDGIIRRAIAKIAFNYLTYWQGAEFALQEVFNPIRFYIRKGEKEENALFVMIRTESILKDEPSQEFRRLIHVITVNWAQSGYSIVSQVSLLNFLSYTVQLVRNYPGQIPNLRKGHFFNLGDHKIYELKAV